MYPNFDLDKYQAFLWAHELVSGKYGDWVILDTETTGLNWNAEAIEICILSKYGSTILDTLIQPTCKIEIGAKAVHGISNEILKTAPTFPEIYDDFYQAVSNKVVVIYNSSFDCRILKYQVDIHGLQPPKFSKHCAMSWYAQYYGVWHEYYENYTWQKLPGGNHRAKGDAIATYNLIKKMAQPLSEEVRLQLPLFPPHQIGCRWEEWLEFRLEKKEDDAYKRDGYKQKLWNLEIKKPVFYKM